MIKYDFNTYDHIFRKEEFDRLCPASKFAQDLIDIMIDSKSSLRR